jgi:hypothetical protein
VQCFQGLTDGPILDPNQPHYTIGAIVGIIFVVIVLAFVAFMCRRKTPDQYEGRKTSLTLMA